MLINYGLNRAASSFFLSFFLSFSFSVLFVLLLFVGGEEDLKLIAALVLFIGFLEISVVFALVFVCLQHSPRGLTFSWWECYGLCLRHESTKLTTLFILFLCLFLSLRPFQLYFIP